MTFPLRIGTSRPCALATLLAGLLTWHSNGSQRLPAHILKGVHSDICCDPHASQRREPSETSLYAFTQVALHSHVRTPFRVTNGGAMTV